MGQCIVGIVRNPGGQERARLAVKKKKKLREGSRQRAREEEGIKEMAVKPAKYVLILKTVLNLG